MSDPVLIALFASLPPTILALATLVQSRKNFNMSAQTGNKADTLIEKTKEIHESTNGNLTKLNTQLEAARIELDAAYTKIRSLESTPSITILPIDTSKGDK